MNTSKPATNFTSIDSEEALAEYLGVTLNKLRFFVRRSSDSLLYHMFTIPKSNNEFRAIHAPRKDLKAIQKQLALQLAKFYEPPLSVHGFISKRSIVTNASVHVGKQAVVSLDIKDFFPCISPQRIFGLLKRPPFNFSSHIAYCLSRILCTDFGLPQGSPASPVLANMICKNMDRKLMGFAKENGAFYTRYADDIVFSFGNKITFKKLFFKDGKFLIPDNLRAIIETYKGKKSFEINEEKVRYSVKSARQIVTGIVVNKKTNLPRKSYRYLRSALDHWRKYGLNNAVMSFFNTINPTDYQINIYEDIIYGHLAYYRMVLGETAFSSTPLMSLGSKFNELSSVRTFPISKPSDSIFLISTEADIDEMLAEGVGFFLQDVGIVTAKHLFDNARLDEDGACVVCVKSFFKNKEFKCRVWISKNRVHPDYDYIVIPLPERIRLQFGHIPPLKAAKVKSRIDDHIESFQLFIENRQLVDKKITGNVSKAPGVPNKYGPIANVDCEFTHGMSGGPVLDLNNAVVGIVHSGSEEGMISKFLSITEKFYFSPEKVDWL